MHLAAARKRSRDVIVCKKSWFLGTCLHFRFKEIEIDVQGKYPQEFNSDYMKREVSQNAKNKADAVFIAGCGYVGSALAEQLKNKGFRVGALTRNEERAAELRELGLDEVVVADLDSREWHDKLNLKYRAVVNCVSSAGGGLAGYQKSYVEGQRSLLEWAQVAQPEIICYTSSTSVYPQSDGVWVDETASTEPSTETSALLLEAEQMLLQSESFPGKAFVLRLAGIYGPGRHYLIDQIKGGETVLAGEGRHHLNLIHRDDAVSGIMAVIESKQDFAGGIYNLCDGQPYIQSDIVRWVAASLSVNCPSFDPEMKTARMLRRKGKSPDRKISNKKLIETTSWRAKFPNFKAGYKALLEDECK